MWPVTAATRSGTKVAAWISAQSETQRRYDPHFRISHGEASCNTAPITSGTVLTSPQATWLPLKASTKTGR